MFGAGQGDFLAALLATLESVGEEKSGSPPPDEAPGQAPRG